MSYLDVIIFAINEFLFLFCDVIISVLIVLSFPLFLLLLTLHTRILQYVYYNTKDMDVTKAARDLLYKICCLELCMQDICNIDDNLFPD